MNELLKKIGVEVSEKAGRVIGDAVCVAGGAVVGWVGKIVYDKFDVGHKLESIIPKKKSIKEEMNEMIEVLDEALDGNKESK